MSEYQLYELIINLFIVMPILIFIHELGHAFFAWLIKIKVKKIIVGKGKKLIELGLFEFRVYIFGGGLCLTEKKLDDCSKLSRILFFLGGSIFNLLFLILMYILINSMIIPNSLIYRNLVVLSIFFILLNLAPVTIFNVNTDGKQIYQTIKYGKSTYLAKSNKTIKETR